MRANKFCNRLNKVLFDATKKLNHFVWLTGKSICLKIRNLIVKNVIDSNEWISQRIKCRASIFWQVEFFVTSYNSRLRLAIGLY